MVEIWFGILKAKCLQYDQFFSVEHLREAIIAFIDTWNEFYAHPFNWSYTGEGLQEKPFAASADCSLSKRIKWMPSFLRDNFFS